MYVPPGFTAEQVVVAINKVAEALTSHAFGVHDADDVRQIVALHCLEVLPRYDPGGFLPNGKPRRGLEGLMYRHAKRRLINLRRDQWRRTDCPCRTCNDAVMRSARHTEHPDGAWCPAFLEWRKRNDAKASIFGPLNLSSQAPGSDDGECWDPADESGHEEEVDLKDVLERIDQLLPIELRDVYLKMRAGVSVPPARRREVEAAVREILEDDGLMPE